MDHSNELQPGLRGGGRGRAVFWCVAVPILATVVYGVSLWQMPEDKLKWFNGEFGPVENISALLFLIIAIDAFLLFRKLGTMSLPMRRAIRFWFALFILGGLFMFLEEISYGQHIFGWESPEAFAELSKQQETNLHNLAGDTPSTVLRRIAEIGLPIFGIILPAVHLLIASSYRPGNWPFYVLPKMEMAVWVLLSNLSRPAREWFGLTGSGPYRGSVSEYQELLWAAALWLYIRVMSRRYRAHANATAAHTETPAKAETETGGA